MVLQIDLSAPSEPLSQNLGESHNSLEKHTEGCLVCGKELIYSESVGTHLCLYCKKEFTSTIHCPEEHFICDECHRADAGEIIETFAENSTSTNPIEMAVEVMSSPAFQMHGPEHHIMVPIVLLTALRNLGIDITRKHLDNVWIRSQQLPGGICGSWGACGAALGAGIALSVSRGLTSLSGEIWGQSNQDTGEILKAVGAYGGPRCCKRTTFSSLRAAMKILERDGIVQFPKKAHSLPTCKDFRRNKQCIRMKCPYYPLLTEV